MEKGQIVFMLDLQNTIDLINDESAHIFMILVEKLREKFKADQAIIFISSQTEYREDLYQPAEILKRNLQPNIQLDDCYFLNGTYNPNTGDYDFIFQVNENKIKVLKEKYLTTDDTKFFAVIDDYMATDSLNEFQNNRPMALIRPSQHEESLAEDNFSCYSSCSFGFEGVIDALDRYLKGIKDLNDQEIFENQKNELFMISGDYACMLFEEGNFELLLSYVENNKILGTGYHQLSYCIREYLMNNHININESNGYIKKIAKLITEYFKAEREKRCL